MKKNKLKNQPTTINQREEDLFFGLCSLLMVSIFYSKALTTICLFGIALMGLKHFTFRKGLSFFSDFRMMPFVLIFFIVLISGIYSYNYSEWLTAIRIKLPFLILPLSFYLLPKIKVQRIFQLHYWLLAVCVVVGIPVLFNTLSHYSEMNELIRKGQSIPTPIEHVKYSMINAYAAVSGIILLLKNNTTQNRRYRGFIVIAILFLILLMHVLVVRTGLAIFYLSVGLLILYVIYKRGLNRFGVLAMGGITLLPIVAYHTIPSIQQKIGYVRHDWKMYQAGENLGYSDSDRLLSYKAALDICKNNPVIGVGYGDIRDEVHIYYSNKYNRPNLYKLPHSQFLLTTAGSGLVGLILFLIGMYIPLKSTSIHSTGGLLLTFLYVNYTLSFLVENSLERSVSVAFFIILTLLLLKSQEGGENKIFQSSLNN